MELRSHGLLHRPWRLLQDFVLSTKIHTETATQSFWRLWRFRLSFTEPRSSFESCYWRMSVRLYTKQTESYLQYHNWGDELHDLLLSPMCSLSGRKRSEDERHRIGIASPRRSAKHDLDFTIGPASSFSYCNLTTLVLSRHLSYFLDIRKVLWVASMTCNSSRQYSCW